MRLKRWLYRGGHPNRLAGLLNRGHAALYALGVRPNWLVRLEVVGRRSGRIITLPLVMAVIGGERYLVSMLGQNVDWVCNVRAAGGRCVLRHGRREEVCLVEVPVELRAPVLKAYLQCAPGARPHVPVDKDSPLSEFENIASQIPVFRVTPAL
jgi:hypothetical protein